MDESLKALKDFIFRDILYILGGVSVILSILYAYDKMDVVCKDLSIFIVLYIVGISYVLGFRVVDPNNILCISHCHHVPKLSTKEMADKIVIYMFYASK